jgi:hypothetical protein
LKRLLNNSAIRVWEWYEPIARQCLQAQFRHLGTIRLIVDGTKIGFGQLLLIVCLAFRKRAIPIAWPSIYETATGNGGVEIIPLSSLPARYLRMESTAWSNSSFRLRLSEFEIFGCYNSSSYITKITD